LKEMVMPRICTIVATAALLTATAASAQPFLVLEHAALDQVTAGATGTATFTTSQSAEGTSSSVCAASNTVSVTPDRATADAIALQATDPANFQLSVTSVVDSTPPFEVDDFISQTIRR
jgi:hypothetical protein